MDLKNKNILIVAAHPDDDLLGCGGTIIKAIKYGSKIKILFLGEGVSSRFNDLKNKENVYKKASDKRYNECKNSLKILGVKDYIFEERLCTRFDELPIGTIVKSIEREIELTSPQIILTHHHSDVNIDHNITHKAVEIATRPNNKTKHLSVYSFEIVCSSNFSFFKNFSPTTYIDISKEINKKVKAWNCYINETKKFPFPRSKEGLITLAKYRGMQSYLKFAEAFKLEREIF